MGVAMYVYKPVDIVMAVSQSLWVLAMYVYKPGDIVIKIIQSLGVDNVCVCVQTWRHCHSSKSVTVGVGNVCRSP